MNKIVHHVTAALLLLAPAVDAALPRGATAAYHLEIDQAYAGPLLAASGGYPAGVLSQQEPAGSFTTRTIARADGTPLEVDFAPAAMTTAFLQWLTGPPAPATLAVVRVAGGTVVDRLVLADTVVSALRVAPLVSGRPVTLGARLIAQHAAIVAGGMPFSAPSGGSKLAHTVLASIGGAPFEVALIDGLGWTRATAAQTRGSDSFATVTNTATCADFTIVAPHSRIADLYAWYDQSVLQRAPDAARTVSIRLTDAAGVERPFVELQEAILFGFEPYNDTSIGMAVKVTLACNGMALAFAPFGK